jgi:ribonuclease D
LSDWIDHDGALPSFLRGAGTGLCLDTEFMRVDTFRPRLALLQVALDDRIALVDPLVVDCAPLGALLEDASRVCVMHSASEDLEAMAAFLPAGPACLFDTQIAAAFAGLGPGIGYQRLVRELTGVELGKGETRSDWMRRPLSERQIEYAAQDVEYLPGLHTALRVRVDARGYGSWLAEDCQRLVERSTRREPDPEPQTAMPGAADWPRERQALLRRVLRWRDRTAREIDRPRPWILDDARALSLCAHPPLDAEDLYERVKGLREMRSTRRPELLQLLQRPLAPEELEFAPIPRAIGAGEKNRLAVLRDYVATRASELDLPPGLLCARRHLETLLTTGHWPSTLDGWRREVLHDGLMERVGENS